jgi:hypothetical protein
MTSDQTHGEIAAALLREVRAFFSMEHATDKEVYHHTVKYLQQAARLEAAANAANLLDRYGNLRKINGTIAVDAGGVIVGERAKLFDVLGNKPQATNIMVWHPCGWGFPDLRHMYSTPASERGEKA